MKKFTSLLLLLLTMFVGGVNHVWAQAVPVPSEGENVYEYYVQNAGTNSGYYLSTAKGSTDQVQFSNRATRLKVKIVALTGDDAGKYQIEATNGPISGKTLIGCTGSNEGAKVQYGSSSENLLFKWYISLENAVGVQGYYMAYSICPENAAKDATSGNSWNFYAGVDASNLALYGHTDQGSKWNFVPANAAAVNKFIEQIQNQQPFAPNNPFSVSVSEAVKKLTGKSDMLAAGLTKRSNSSIDINIPTGYYRMRNADVDGENGSFGSYLFSDYSKKFAGENVWNTLANVPAEADAYNNNYIWHLTKAEGSNEVAILSGQGVGVHNSTEHKTIHTGLSDYWSSGMVYFTEGLHITNQAKPDFTINGTKNSNAEATQTNPFKMTSWNHSDSKGSAYYLEPVDLTKYDIYTVTFVNAGEGAKVEYNGMVALNGGFFAVTKGKTISKDDLTPTTGKTNNVVTINDHAITIDCSVLVSYIYQIDGKQITKTLKLEEGSAANAPTLPFISFTQPEATIAPDNNRFVLECQIALPFTVSANTENATWFAINMHTNQANYVWTVEDGENVTLPTLETTSVGEIPAKSLWCILGNYVDGYKFYNKGARKYLVASDPATVGEEGSSLKLYNSGVDNTGFCIYQTEGTYLNHQGSSLKTWSANDHGSTCHVVAPYAYALNYAAQYTQFPKNALNSLSAYSPEKYEALSKVVDAVKADPSAVNVANLYSTNADISSIAGNIPTNKTVEAGKYYRLYSVPEAKYLTVYRSGDSNLMHNDATTAKSPASVFQFVESETEGQYFMMVEGLTLGKVTKSHDVQLVDAEANKGKFEVAHEGIYFTFLDKTNSESQYAHLHVNDGNCVGWEASAAKTQWVVVPATDIEVALTKVNDNAYATAYLPFPVSAVSGAKAYVGKLNAEGTTVTLEEATGIAANEGVVLMGAADATKATLTIGGTAEKVTGNAFAGTNTEIAFSDAISRDNYLVFGRKSGETTNIGFFKPSEKVTKIPANRAYIANTSTNGTSSVLVNFGTVEGLGSIVTETSEDANSPIYDLSGRRVMHTVKGGLYIRNGKKFLVK